MIKILALLSLSSHCFGSEVVHKLSLEEKIGQLLMVDFQGEVANEDAKVLIQDIKVGGMIYYGWRNGLHSPEQIQALSAGLQELSLGTPSGIPLLIAADQEGGAVARWNKGCTQFPGNRALGETGEPRLAEAAAFAMGKELRAVGINMNLAPVVDVNSNPRNPIIGVRSFGEDPELVSILGASALEGYKKAHMIATLKHFPGHGDTAVDSHEDLPLVLKSIEELEQVELLPFARLASSTEAMMTAHILVPAFDTENCSTISKRTLDFLKEVLDFQGLIVSDSLIMEGVLKKCGTIEEAAIRAVEAGCHLLILGGKFSAGARAGLALTVDDIQSVHRAMIDAVKRGRLSETKINQAVQKILDLKQRYIVSEERSLPLSEAVNTMAHRMIAQEVASLALRTIKQAGDVSFHEQRVTVFAPQLLKENIDQTSLLKIGKTTDSYFFNGLNPSGDEIDIAQQNASDADALFVCSYNAWKNPSQMTLIQSLIDTGKPVVLLVVRDSMDASLFPAARLIFNTFSPSAPSIQAVCDVLSKGLHFSFEDLQENVIECGSS